MRKDPLKALGIGFNHQSNGRSEPLSRSWNRVVANFGFERDALVFLRDVWYRIPEDEEDDDNPNIEDYLVCYDKRIWPTTT